MLRTTILDAACSWGNDQCLKEAATRFSAWLAKPASLPNPDIRSIVYNYGMEQMGNEKSWNQVLALFVNEQDAQEKMKLMKCLSSVQIPWILQR